MKPSHVTRPRHVGQRARVLAQRYLRFGPRSVAQVRRYLDTRGMAEPVINAVVAECRRSGALDDHAAATLIAEHLADRGYGRAAMHHRLIEQGFADAVTRRTLLAMASAADEARRIRALVQRRLGAASPRRDQLARWLAQRGFDSDLIEQVLTDIPSFPSGD